MQQYPQREKETATNRGKLEESAEIDFDDLRASVPEVVTACERNGVCVSKDVAAQAEERLSAIGTAPRRPYIGHRED